MSTPRTYKGYQIVKQYVGPCGWNVVNPEGRCVKTGFSSIAAAKEFISYEVEVAQFRGIEI